MTRRKDLIETTGASQLRSQVLLEEYRICSEEVGHLDQLIWQTASVIFPITVAGFIYFGLSSNHPRDQFFIVLPVAIGSITLLVTWYFLSRAWYVYQSIAFYRLREIETELGMYHYRYSLYIRNSDPARASMLANLPHNQVERYKKMGANVRRLPLIGLRRTTAIITAMFLMGWIALVVREFVLCFLS